MRRGGKSRIILVVRQRATGDCGLAALVSYASAVTGITYDDATLAALDENPQWNGTGGLQNKQLVNIAARLGIALRQTRQYDLTTDHGLLRIRSPQHYSGGHWIAVKFGVAADPADASIQPVPDYLRRYQARACSLLMGEI